MRNPFKQELVEKFLDQNLPITFYCNTINAAAKQKLLEGVQP
jgi:hypothetical protein